MVSASCDDVWLKKLDYDRAEIKYYEQLAKSSITPLAGEVAKTRQLLIDSRNKFKKVSPIMKSQGQQIKPMSEDNGTINFLKDSLLQYKKQFNEILTRIDELSARVSALEQSNNQVKSVHEINTSNLKKVANDDDDDVDLFDSDSDEEIDAVKKIKEENLAAYNAKKAKKPAVVAKSSVILDVKTWSDEVDMKEVEAAVRKISADGLLWGASKLVPLAYGIYKLQINCVVEDEKISIDWLQEEISSLEDYVQSVDIAAFNKI